MLNNAIMVALACGVLALVYGGVTAAWILKQPDGNDRMREIAAAVQTGAKAYLNRQYTTIAIVGVVIFVILGLVQGWAGSRRWASRSAPSPRAPRDTSA
jgi:K(+)-stimulated pyrophosphate-energized sodium pump